MSKQPNNPIKPIQAAPGLMRRMACFLYEGLLLFGVVFVSGYLFGTLSQTRNAMDNRHALQAFLFVIFGIYFVWFWSKGQTLAMKTWHIMVCDLQNQRLTQSRALLRYVVSWLWFLPSLGAAWLFELRGTTAITVVSVWVLLWGMLSQLHPQRQFFHDALAGTRLISCKQPDKN